MLVLLLALGVTSGCQHRVSAREPGQELHGLRMKNAGPVLEQCRVLDPGEPQPYGVESCEAERAQPQDR